MTTEDDTGLEHRHGRTHDHDHDTPHEHVPALGAAPDGLRDALAWDAGTALLAGVTGGAVLLALLLLVAARAARARTARRRAAELTARGRRALAGRSVDEAWRPSGGGAALPPPDDGIARASEAYGLSRGGDGHIYASRRDGSAFEIDKTGLRSQNIEIASSKPIRWDDHWVAAI